MSKNKIKPDLIISGLTSTDDIINLLEKGTTELYSVQSILKILLNAGIPEAGTIFLTEILVER